MKILISWMAFNHDFIGGKQVNKEGTTFTFHKFFFKPKEFDKHVILSSASDEREDQRKLTMLTSELMREFSWLKPRKEEQVLVKAYLDIKDVIDVNEIRAAFEGVLDDYKEHEIFIFTSPGTPQMMLASYLCHIDTPGKTHLIQVREARFSKSGKPELMETMVNKSPVPNQLTLAKAINDQTEILSHDEDILITESIVPVYKDAELIAKANASPPVTTLILGATGTGKEHLANYIHIHSNRHSKAYKAINCSSYTDELLASTLFGHKKGAFTGAMNDRKGIFEEANGGTLFLDEIGDISPYMQRSLLRVLQSGEVQAVGANEIKKVDVKIICATHKDLAQMCEEGTFRWDLFYRISNSELRLPTLQERGAEEKKQYLDHLLVSLSKKFNKSKPVKLSREVMNVLLTYSFPGNLRELFSVITTICIYENEGEFTDLRRLPARLSREKDPGSLLWEAAEKIHIEKVLKLMNGNQSKTKVALGYGSINTLKKKIDGYGIVLEKS